jgi:glycine cleavage system H lipoate-binding protein
MQGDIFATKGIEYLLVVGYFMLLIALARFLAPRREAAPVRARPTGDRRSWFSVPEGYHFHPGHSWATRGDGDLLTVGLDDFTAQLVGVPDAIALPAVGDHVHQGEPGWRVRTGDRTLAMVAPVEGEVVAVNAAVLDAPGLATEDPYGGGWLLKVRAPNRAASLRNLLSGKLASVWMSHTGEWLRSMTGGELGMTMMDGGMPVRGFGRVLGPEEWQVVASEFFLSD